MDYWKECIADAAAECGASLTEEQISSIARTVEGAHEYYGQATGQDVADRNWRAKEDNNLRKEGAAKVLSYIEDRVSEIDAGPSRAFEAMTDRQRLALHEIFAARRFLRKQGVPVG